MGSRLILGMMSLASVLFCSSRAPAAPGHAGTEPSTAQEPELQRLLRDGDRLSKSGEFGAAREPLEKAVALSEQQGDSASLARALNLLGNTLWGLGDYAGSLPVYKRALELFRTLGSAEGEAWALCNIGNALHSMGDYPQALSYFSQSLQIAEPRHLPAVAGMALSNTGIVHRYLGRFREATDYLQRALRLQREAGDDRGVGLTLNQLGIVSRARGEYQRALEFYRESLEERRKAGDRRGEAQTLNNIGNVYLDLGRLEVAMDYFGQSLARAQEISYRAQVGISHMNIADVLKDLGRFDEARTHCEAALDVSRQINRPTTTANTLMILGDLRRESLHDLPGARAAYLEAADIGRVIHEPETRALALDGLADTDLESGSAAEALGQLDEALALARSSRAPDVEYMVRADRARALRALGRNEEALAEFTQSARIVNDLRANVKTDPGKVGFLDRRQSVFTEWAEALREAGRDAEALEVAEAGRARAIADLLAQRTVKGKLPAREILEDVRATLEERQASARPRVGPSPASADGSAPRGADLENQLARLSSQDKELASLITVESPTIEEIKRDAARLHAVVVEYLVGPTRLLAWVVQPGGSVTSARNDVGWEALASETKRLRRDLDDAGADDLRHPERLRPVLRKLDAALIEPVRRWLPNSTDALVVIVPHGPLWLVPFAALVDDKGRSLAERCSLSIVPSVSVFRYTAAKGAALPGARRALIVADPLPPRGSSLPPLGGSREEAARVRARLGPDRALLLEGAAATEAAVKRFSAQYGILHFATHGLIAEDQPLESSLVFAEGNGEDGYLRVDEVFGLDLKADLVVLSGCSTGLGRLSGDGVLGLTRAFLYAGTRSLIVSQWDVSDRATAFLMDRFYAGLGAGRGKAAALRAAELAAKRRWPHPAVWAAFELVGEPR